MLAKFARANLASTFSPVNLLNSGVKIYLLWSAILFSTAVRVVVVVAKLVILGISFLISFILFLIILLLILLLVAKLVISGILSLISLVLPRYIPFFRLHHVVYLNQQQQVLIYLICLSYF